MANAVTSTSAARARSATLVVVGPPARLTDAAAVLGAAEDAGALRIVLVSTVSEPLAPVPALPDVVTIGNLKREYVNNAIAAVRLSSLPTAVWWRGGPPEELDGVASLADRVILDAEDPWPGWGRIPPFFDHTAFTDLRWTKLTRWRSGMAHFFDLHEVRDASVFTRLSIAGNDRAQCALFAGWLDSALGWHGRPAPEFLPSASGAAMESVSLQSERGELSLKALPNSTCLDTRATAGDRLLASRVLSLGDQSPLALLSEELRVRSRDLAFEAAVLSARRG